MAHGILKGQPSKGSGYKLSNPNTRRLMSQVEGMNPPSPVKAAIARARASKSKGAPYMQRRHGR